MDLFIQVVPAVIPQNSMKSKHDLFQRNVALRESTLCRIKFICASSMLPRLCIRLSLVVSAPIRTVTEAVVDLSLLLGT